jgi:hypothetical protein
MKMNRLFAIAAMTALFAMIAMAADITGKWVGQVPGRQGTQETTFNFKQAGDQLTGTMTNQAGDFPIKEGKITGDDIAFKVTLEFNGNSIGLVFNGKVSGGELKMKRTREGSDQAQEFSLKKAS